MADVEIRIPRETVNDDVVTLLEWLHAGGAAVRRGQAVANVETSKAVIELEAETDGYLDIVVAAGSEVPVGSVIGMLRGAPSGVGAKPAVGATPVPAAAASAPSGSSPTFSRKAQELITQRGIDPGVFRGATLVRESDVIRHLGAPDATPERGASSEARPSAPPPALPGSFLDEARNSARDRGTNLFTLGLNYIFRNWLLGLIARASPHGMILVVHRWRGVRIGKGVFIDPTATLETAYPENITIGNDVRVTAHAIIMTHIKAPHYLRRTGAVPLTLKPVVLEDHCFIGVHAVVMPGVTVGRGAVVASGAVVVTNVPAHTMVAGNPARVVRRFPTSTQESTSSGTS